MGRRLIRFNSPLGDGEMPAAWRGHRRVFQFSKIGRFDLGGGTVFGAATVAFLLLSTGLSSVARAGTLVEDVTLEHGGLTRYFDYYVPDGNPATSAPLLFVLHGGTRSKIDMRVGPMGEFLGLADQYGFFVVLPNGVDPETGESGVNGSFNWNDCRNDAGASATSADDVGFIGALINWMDENRNIDLQRVYVAGGSNGGMMAYRLAFELSDRVSAVAAVIANLPGNSECEPHPAHPISVLLMNGTLDIFIPYAGGQVLGNRGLVLSADATRDFFTNFLGTDADPEHVDFPDLDPSDAGDVGRDTYRGGMEGNEVVFYRANGAGHNFPSIAHPLGPGGEAIFGEQNHDIESAVEIWDFFHGRELEPTSVPASRAWGTAIVATLLMALGFTALALRQRASATRH